MKLRFLPLVILGTIIAKQVMDSGSALQQLAAWSGLFAPVVAWVLISLRNLKDGPAQG